MKSYCPKSMLKLKAILIALLFSLPSFSQVTLDKTFPSADEEITITYDATLGTSGLTGASGIIMHSGAVVGGPTSTSWDYVEGNWGDPNAAGKMNNIGTDLWQITITPRSYFAAAGLSTTEIVYRIGMVFREEGPCGGFNNNSTPCKEGKNDANQDIFVDLNPGRLIVRFTTPAVDPVFVNPSDTIALVIKASEAASLSLTSGGTTLATATNTDSLVTSFIAGLSGSSTIIASATTATETDTDSITLIVREAPALAKRPPGIIDGINYSSDQTIATLSLWAPKNTSAYVTGDFNNWTIDPTWQMKKDGEHFWMEITGLTPGMEYGFQYLIDEQVFIADPFADKILDPDDKYIPASTYPGLKAYPTGARRSAWYYNRVAVLQTGQNTYPWKVGQYTPPQKSNLVIYELLLRDFFGPGEQNYQNLIDTLSYFKNLGINAIQLMPIMEFNGNESWGYNPTFMFAPDKFYGTKIKLKEFIDAAHQQGIAVILDIALNHQDIPGPYLLMDFDFNMMKPKAGNPWFNTDATHPYNVFYDFNHQSAYTQAYLDTVAQYWLNEYHVDGFRFDLSKGFTQTKSGGNVDYWSQYDASRVALLKRMADKIWSHHPNAYVILEHFADNTEELELATHGMLLWGNMNHNFGQNLMGYTEQSDIRWAYYGNRGWPTPGLITYMESHDEERLMYKAYQWGSSLGDYNVRDSITVLQRSRALAALFYTIPGPKMLWQFGELGYDVSIDLGGRLSIKPTKWEYYDSNNRGHFYSLVSSFIKLKTTYSIFDTQDVRILGDDGLIKQIILKNTPYNENPASPENMNLAIAANLGLARTDVMVEFPHTGTWYDYYSGTSLNVDAIPFGQAMNPGEFRLFTDVELTQPDLILGTDQKAISTITFYPNPATTRVYIADTENNAAFKACFYNLQGQLVLTEQLDPNRSFIDIGHLPGGIYIISIPETNTRLKLLISD